MSAEQLLATIFTRSRKRVQNLQYSKLIIQFQFLSPFKIEQTDEWRQRIFQHKHRYLKKQNLKIKYFYNTKIIDKRSKHYMIFK